eukprot:scaffold22595_cov63-Phaeocystis_antarctica.AAC.6
MRLTPRLIRHNQHAALEHLQRKAVSSRVLLARRHLLEDARLETAERLAHKREPGVVGHVGRHLLTAVPTRPVGGAHGVAALVAAVAVRLLAERAVAQSRHRVHDRRAGALEDVGEGELRRVAHPRLVPIERRRLVGVLLAQFSAVADHPVEDHRGGIIISLGEQLARVAALQCIGAPAHARHAGGGGQRHHILRCSRRRLLRGSLLPPLEARHCQCGPEVVLPPGGNLLVHVLLGEQADLVQVLHAEVVVIVEGTQPGQARTGELLRRVLLHKVVLLGHRNQRPAPEELLPVLGHVLRAPDKVQRVAAQEGDAAVGQVRGDARDAVLDCEEEGESGVAREPGAVAARQLVQDQVKIQHATCRVFARHQAHGHCRLPHGGLAVAARWLKADARVPGRQEARDRIAHPHHDAPGADASRQGR